MAGRGERGEVPDVSNPHIFMLRNGQFRPLREPVNIDRPIYGPPGSVRSGIGPAASFADTYQRAVGGDVGVIPCAEGGSGLDEWMPGRVLYDHAVSEARFAMRASTLGGILWHQGENEAGVRDDAETYFDRVCVMIRALRRDLGDERLPFLIGQLGPFIREREDEPFYDIVDAAHRRAAAELPRCAYVSAEGLTCKPDRLHFDSAGARAFGVRYAEALLELDR